MSSATLSAAAAESPSGRPADMPWVTPYLTVKDVRAAVDFYEAAFGFTRRDIHDGPDGRASHASVIWRDGMVMMGLEGAYGGTTLAPSTTGNACPVSIYVYCAAVDVLARQAEAAGAQVKYGPMDTFYGDRICGLVDPDGYLWCFATTLGSAPQS